MTTSSSTSNRYPIGTFTFPAGKNELNIPSLIAKIQQFPELLRKETEFLTNEQLDTPYRVDGWTIRQVIHHLADSHMNAYIRFKLAFTEENPVIKPYFEDRWAETEDGKWGAIEVSLDLVEALHKRWVLFMNSLSDSDFDLTFYHPESQKNIRLYECLALYCWHCAHHLAHITSLTREQNPKK